MTAFRTAKNDRAYKAYQKNNLKDSCAFCDPYIGEQHIVDETTHFYILKNSFPYNVWDARRVKEHLMIVPKRHVISLNNLSAAERLENESLVASHEVAGYNIYSRAASSTSRSIAHQHTHLIKTSKIVIPFILLSLHRPFVRFVR